MIVYRLAALLAVVSGAGLVGVAALAGSASGAFVGGFAFTLGVLALALAPLVQAGR